MLFYVVDDKTRAVSSMVELGYYTGKMSSINAQFCCSLISNPSKTGPDKHCIIITIQN